MTSISRSSLSIPLAAALLCGFPAAATGLNGTTLTGAGWTIEADEAVREMKQWTIEICGPELHQSSSAAPKPEPWTPESGIPGRLLLRTTEPPGTWIFEPARDELRISVDVDGHDTRVLLIHRLLDRPQLIGTSRHITGAYSIENLSFDAAAKTLQGLSQVVLDADYTLHIHLPPGTTAASSPRASAGGSPIRIRQERFGNLYSVTFKSPKSPVAWQARF